MASGGNISQIRSVLGRAASFDVGGGSTFTVTNPRALRDAIAPATRQVANDLKDLCSAYTPRDSGKLANSYRVRPGDAPGAYLVTTDVDYFRYVEFGTKFHPPVAMVGRALAVIRARYGATKIRARYG